MRLMRCIRHSAMLILCSLFLPMNAFADELDVPAVTQKSSWVVLLIIALVAFCLVLSVILYRKYRK